MSGGLKVVVGEAFVLAEAPLVAHLLVDVFGTGFGETVAESLDGSGEGGSGGRGGDTGSDFNFCIDSVWNQGRIPSMARKVRIEYEGAIYHVINRGNYRSWIFESGGAREAFDGCLFEACEKSEWVLHAYALIEHGYFQWSEPLCRPLG